VKASAFLCLKGEFYLLTLSLMFPYGNRTGSGLKRTVEEVEGEVGEREVILSPGIL